MNESPGLESEPAVDETPTRLRILFIMARPQADEPRKTRPSSLMKRHVLFIGAHPDDCEFSCGGTALRMADRGDAVKFVSVTNGDRGHMSDEYRNDRQALARRRQKEAEAAAEILGGSYETLGVHDGSVYVTEELTERMIRCIRSWGEPGVGPDLVVVNRSNDYHRDHRYTAQLVLDASFMLTVPFICPETPCLARMPVIAYWHDFFREGGEFRPDVVVSIDDVFDRKIDLVRAHESQFFEWLPHLAGELDQVPCHPEARRAWVNEKMRARGERVRADCARGDGNPLFNQELAEAYQISEYGRQPAAQELSQLFPADAG